MKRIIFLLVLSCSLALPSAVKAQSSDADHFEVEVFADYLNLSTTDPHINFIGVGGRAALNVHPNVQLEGEMSYDFERNYTSVFTNGVTSQFVQTSLRPLTALFGPKFQTSSGPFRAYVTGKLGFVNFSVSDQNVPSGFVGALGGVQTGDTRFAMYPGGGVEGFWGPFGLRLEAGDEIYFDNGTHNNLKVTFGPAIRF
jgi:Outer membrane protein beta-barrel domain